MPPLTTLLTPVLLQDAPETCSKELVRSLRERLTQLRAMILLRALLVFQDAADSLTALHEITGARLWEGGQ